MNKLNKLFAILFAMLGVGTLSAQTWIAPVVGVNLSEVNNSTELYLYNVNADAFACSGMNWQTHAIVKELQNGDSKLSAAVHNCTINKPAVGQVQISLNGRTYLGGGGAASTNDCWVDQGNNNVYTYTETSTNVYKLKPTTATGESYLDCSWAYGGHITFSGTNGYGNTEWAFVLRSDITSGKYLLYKAKKEMYDIYEALVAAGHKETYADALATANAAYVATDATAASVNAATKTLLARVSPVLSSKYFAANSLFNNPDMRGYGDDTDWGNGLNAFANGIFESWHSSETITQTQTGLPNGFYTVVFLGMYRQDGSDAAPTLTLTSGGNSSVSSLKATSEIDFGSITNVGKNANNADDWTSSKPNNTYGAGEALAHTDAGVKVENFVVENGELTITVAMPSKSQWLLCQGFQIYYKAESLEEYANLFYAAKSAAEVIDLETLNAYAADKLSTALSNAATEQVDKAWYQQRTAELNEAVTLASAIAAPYVSLQSLIAVCTEYTDPKNSNANSADVLNAFQAAIITATTDGDAATTVDAINAAYNTLETARRTYAQNAVPVYPYPFDMTFLLPNTTFDSNIDGWTKTGGANWMSSGKNVECYNTTFDFSMEYAGLNSGSWEIQVDAFYRYGGYNDAEKAHNGGTEQLYAILYANNNEVAVKSIMEGANKAGSVGATTTNGVRVPNGPADCDAYFTTGCYANSIATVIADGKLKVGIKKETTQGADWTIFDNFKLIYKGIDVTDLQSALSELKEKASGIKETKMGATELTALTNALEKADTESTNADNLGNMISTLQSAYDAAVVSIEFYATVLPYITKADSIDASIAAEYRTQYDNGTIAESAETVFQNLEVATYNYVMNNFTYLVALSDTWNSTGVNTSAADFSDEHWSGEARRYKNQHDGWGDPKQGYPANSWSIDFDQEITLPAGKYVFKVAGRKSIDTALELVVTEGENVLGTVNDFPSGNSGLGINKEGATSFDANDPVGFALKLNDKGEVERTGYGWQWRYVKFELNAEATVKVAVHAETNMIYNWVSFGDYTLQMTEDTYLEANKGGLDAPTAAAEALVNTKPMGNAENEALEAALAMTYTTGAGLQEKINALNTAVANANAWLAAYNEAKAPLVAALERFETDYNNAENGALDHMNKNRWATAIEKAQAAAEAKDVTNSYDGFEGATAALVAALDAATESVNEYASLKSAITEADAVRKSLVNWGDAAFQRPESAREGLNTAISAAESGYNAADADGEEVTALVNSMVVTLNAPQDAYCITVATDGHAYVDCPIVATLGSITGNNPTGYGLAAKKENEDLLAQLYTFTQVEGNKYRISVTVEGETVYLTYGVLNGSPATWNKEQIQGNTDIAKAGEFEVVASTTTEGVFRLRNTVTGTYLDCQDDGGAIYTDDNITKDEFALTSATASTAINISAEAKLGTCVLMFDAQLPDGLTAYVPESYDDETTVLTLKMVTGGVLPAYTPCLLYAEDGYEGTLTGTVTMNGYADKVTGEDGLLYGAIEAQTITEGYILQKHEGEEVAKFYNVDGAEVPIPAGKCWLTLANGVEGTIETPAAVAFFFRGGGATKLNAVVMDKTALDGAIYTLDGKRVNTMQRGEIYIINGQKVMVK